VPLSAQLNQCTFSKFEPEPLKQKCIRLRWRQSSCTRQGPTSSTSAHISSAVRSSQPLSQVTKMPCMFGMEAPEPFGCRGNMLTGRLAFHPVHVCAPEQKHAHTEHKVLSTHAPSNIWPSSPRPVARLRELS
jgi:hypothetical protein